MSKPEDFEPGGQHYGKVAPIELLKKVDELQPGEVIETSVGEGVIMTHTYKPKGLRIVEECERTGEPYFVLRAKDVLSPFILEEYARLVGIFRPSNHEMNEGVAIKRAEFTEWMDVNSHEVHLPD